MASTDNAKPAPARPKQDKAVIANNIMNIENRCFSIICDKYIQFL